MATQLQELNGVALPAGVDVQAGPGGLPRLRVQNALGQAEVCLHGAHVTHFQAQGQKPLLWMSAKSWFEAGKPIRGGIPICWPWFGPNTSKPGLPAHGFARLKTWSLLRAAALPDGRTQIVLGLRADEQTRALWPHEFELEYSVTVGGALELALRVCNTGTDAFDFEEALHTYLTVSDIHGVEISGLAGDTYIDKMNGAQKRVEGPQPIKFSGETDRTYVNTSGKCEVNDPARGWIIAVAKKNSLTTVVWNPWIAKSKAMPDFGDEEWPGMVCVETANAADNRLSLKPGASHEIQVGLSARTQK